MEESAVRRFRSPQRLVSDERDRELAVLVANVPGAIYRCALDPDWTMAVITGEIERISGFPPSDFVDSARRTFGSIIHPDDRAVVHREIQAATDEDRPFGLEYRILRRDGAIAWVLERGQLVITVPSGEAWLHGVIFDITERKQAEEVLRQHEAEQARIAELKAARVRILAAQDATRREIERDLHDGAQQQLVTLALTLRMIKSTLASNPGAASILVDEAIADLAEATAELRELARGIHPTVLTEKGLRAAVEVLAARTPVSVRVDCSISKRLPTAIEVAAYYAVAEALTNVARYANAGEATVRLSRRGEWLFVEISDDGAGGADPATGTGLRGLNDRIEALDGALTITSPPGQGTHLHVKLPLTPGSSAGRGQAE